MLSLPLFTLISTDAYSSDDWEHLWRQRQAELVLNGITLEEHFRERIKILDKLLDGLIGRFRKTELVSSPVLGVVAEVIEQIDEEFLGIEAWQEVEDLPARVSNLSSLEAMSHIQHCLSALRLRIRLMHSLLPQMEREPRLAFQNPETLEKLVKTQEEVLENFRQLRQLLKELLKHM